MQASPSSSMQAKVIHTGIFCDECSVRDMIDLRYKCGVCKDYDLCSMCYRGRTHDRSHPFLVVDTPFDFSSTPLLNNNTYRQRTDPIPSSNKPPFSFESTPNPYARPATPVGFASFNNSQSSAFGVPPMKSASLPPTTFGGKPASTSATTKQSSPFSFNNNNSSFTSNWGNNTTTSFGGGNKVDTSPSANNNIATFSFGQPFVTKHSTNVADCDMT